VSDGLHLLAIIEAKAEHGTFLVAAHQM